MKRLSGLVLVSCFLIACTQGQAPAPATTPQAAAPQPRPYSNLAQVMRGIPFPNSNIIFDTQSNDPAAAAKAPEGSGGGGGSVGSATSAFGGVYGGWQAVENA